MISGAGAAGVAVARILLAAGVTRPRGDRPPGRAALRPRRPDPGQAGARRATPPTAPGAPGSLADVMAGADVYIGVSGGTVPEEVVATMADDAIIFGLANPTPEVHPDVAHRHARVVATGRSDFPNQINNVLAFPGIFRGAFDVRATAITEGMKLAAANALADAGRRRPARGLRHPVAVRPAGRAGGRRGGRRARPGADGVARR